ncbi:MAG: hypothetical protein ABW145_00895, partial [Candidatus Thiodiazotropha sp.]
MQSFLMRFFTLDWAMVHPFVIRIRHPLWQVWRRFRPQLSKAGISPCLFNIMRVVTFSTDPPAFFAALVPHADSLTV